MSLHDTAYFATRLEATGLGHAGVEFRAGVSPTRTAAVTVLLAACVAIAVEGDTSIKDVVGHRAHWIELFFGWHKEGLAGKPVFFPAKGYKWNQLKEYNKALRAKQKALGWVDAKKKLRSNHKKLLKFIEKHSNEELYGGPMKGANNDWTSGRWAEAAGSSHYRSAAKFIRECLRDDE